MKVERGTRLDAAEAALRAHGEIRGMRLGRSAAGIMEKVEKRLAHSGVYTSDVSLARRTSARDTLQAHTA